jgi:hypothetical protein
VSIEQSLRVGLEHHRVPLNDRFLGLACVARFLSEFLFQALEDALVFLFSFANQDDGLEQFLV